MCGGVSYCIAPTSLPSVSRKRTRAPTVGITAFGNVTLPPCRSTAAAMASTSATAKVGSNPFRPPPVRGSLRACRRPWMPGSSAVPVWMR